MPETTRSRQANRAAAFAPGCAATPQPRLTVAGVQLRARLDPRLRALALTIDAAHAEPWLIGHGPGVRLRASIQGARIADAAIPARPAAAAARPGADPAWRARARDATRAARFLPATEDDDPPALHIAGVLAFLYLDGADEVTVRLSVDLDTAEHWLVAPDSTVPVTVTAAGRLSLPTRTTGTPRRP